MQRAYDALGLSYKQATSGNAVSPIRPSISTQPGVLSFQVLCGKLNHCIFNSSFKTMIVCMQKTNLNWQSLYFLLNLNFKIVFLCHLKSLFYLF